MNHVPLKRISLKAHPEVNEAWLQKLLAEQPMLMGLGGPDLYAVQRERRMPGGGRLDLLLQEDFEDEPSHRFEVEIQLGDTDPSHIIRCLEYWDLERNRYPKYKHTLVLVAENITGRFLNVIRLFNGFLPVVALQLSAFEAPGGGISLTFTKVVTPIEPVDETDEAERPTTPANKADWEKWGSPETSKEMEEVISLAKTFAPNLAPNFTRAYIGILQNNRVWNFAWGKPRKRELLLNIDALQTSAHDEALTSAGIRFKYLADEERYRMWLSPGDLKANATAITALLRDAYERHRNA